MTQFWNNFHRVIGKAINSRNVVINKTKGHKHDSQFRLASIPAILKSFIGV